MASNTEATAKHEINVIKTYTLYWQPTIHQALDGLDTKPNNLLSMTIILGNCNTWCHITNKQQIKALGEQNPLPRYYFLFIFSVKLHSG